MDTNRNSDVDPEPLQRKSEADNGADEGRGPWGRLPSEPSWRGSEWFRESGFDAYLVGRLLDRGELARISTSQLWLVKLKVIDEILQSGTVRRHLRKAAKKAVRELAR